MPCKEHEPRESVESPRLTHASLRHSIRPSIYIHLPYLTVPVLTMQARHAAEADLCGFQEEFEWSCVVLAARRGGRDTRIPIPGAGTGGLWGGGVEDDVDYLPASPVPTPAATSCVRACMNKCRPHP